MKSMMTLIMNEQDKMKLNKDHKFFSVEQQTIFQETNNIAGKIMPIIRMVLIKRGYLRKEKNVMYNPDTREFVILKSLSKAEKSLSATYKKLSEEQYGNVKIVVCFINAESVDTEINTGLGFNVKVYAGEKALDYLFKEDKQEIISLIKTEIRKKIEKVIASMSVSFDVDINFLIKKCHEKQS